MESQFLTFDRRKSEGKKTERFLLEMRHNANISY